MDPNCFKDVPNEVLLKVRDWLLKNEKQLPSTIPSLQNVLLSISFQVLRLDPILILDWLIQQQVLLINECGLVVYNKSHLVFLKSPTEPLMRFQVFAQMVQYHVGLWLWNQKYCLPTRKESLLRGIQQFCVYRVPIDINLVIEKLREKGYISIQESKICYFPYNSVSRVQKRKEVDEDEESEVPLACKRQNTSECDTMCM